MADSCAHSALTYNLSEDNIYCDTCERYWDMTAHCIIFHKLNGFSPLNTYLGIPDYPYEDNQKLLCD